MGNGRLLAGGGAAGVRCGLVPLLYPPDSTPGRAGTNIRDKAPDSARRPEVVDCVSSEADGPPVLKPHLHPWDGCLRDLLGLPETQAGSGHRREKGDSLLVAGGSTPGSGPPPRAPGLS